MKKWTYFNPYTTEEMIENIRKCGFPNPAYVPNPNTSPSSYEIKIAMPPNGAAPNDAQGLGAEALEPPPYSSPDRPFFTPYASEEQRQRALAARSVRFKIYFVLIMGFCLVAILAWIIRIINTEQQIRSRQLDLDKLKTMQKFELSGRSTVDDSTNSFQLEKFSEWPKDKLDDLIRRIKEQMNQTPDWQKELSQISNDVEERIKDLGFIQQIEEQHEFVLTPTADPPKPPHGGDVDIPNKTNPLDRP